MVFVVDETKHEVSTGFFDKISFDSARLHQLGLFQSHSKIGWLCGDYFYYMMALDRPNYSGYWLIEDDAFVSADDLVGLLSKPLTDGIDFVAHHLAPANGKFLTGWAASMQHAVGSPDPLLKCLFCITYMSKALVMDCLRYRKDMSKKYMTNEIDKFQYPFPNDESHAANIPSRGKFNFAAMKDVYPNMCDDFHYTSHGVVFDIDPLKAPVESGFYHPIRIVASDVDELESRLALKSKQSHEDLEHEVISTTDWLINKAYEIKAKYQATPSDL